MPAAIAILALVGWASDADVLVRWLPGRPSMSVGTATLVLALGAAAVLARRDLQRIVATATLTATGAVLLARVLDRVPDALNAGLPSVPTALTLGCLAIALALPPTIAATGALAAGWAAAYIGLIGHLFQASALYGQVDADVGMALPTAISTALIAIAAAHLRSESPPWEVLLRAGPGGTLARVLLPVSLTAPPLIGVVVLRFAAPDPFEPAPWAILVGLIALTQTGVVLLLGTTLDRIHHQLEATADELAHTVSRERARSDQLVRLIDATDRLVTVLDPEMLDHAIERITTSLLGADTARIEAGTPEPGAGSPNSAALEVSGRTGMSAFLHVTRTRPFDAADQTILQLLAAHAAQLRSNAAAFQRERDLNAARSALARSTESILGSLSHEMRTPLTIIHGALSTLQLPSVTDDVRNELIRRAALHTDRLDRLIGDLLDIERLSRNDIVPLVDRVNLALVTRATADQFETRTGREIERRLEDVIVEADANHISRVVDHLLDNARKYGAQNGRIVCGVEARDGRAELIIDDDGPGLPASLRDIAFSAFGRGASVIAHAPGLGLGLALVNGYTRLAGGTVRTDTSPLGGARIIVSLPLAHVGDPLPPLSTTRAGIH